MRVATDGGLMAKDVKLDHRGISQLLKSLEMREAVHSAAENAAAALRSDPSVVRNGVAVTVEDYTTDRAACSVSIAHPAGVAIQAKHGSVTKAARAAGLQVKGKK